MINIGVIVCARLNSMRLEKKMLRPFADTTLIDISLNLLNQLKGVSVYYGAGEEELIERVSSYPNITLLKRDYESLNLDFPLTTIFKCFKDIKEDYILKLNPCTPFLSVNTIQKFIEFWDKHHYRAVTSVIKDNGWYYSLEGKPLNIVDPKSGDTKTSEQVYKVAHAFHLFEKKRFFETGNIWTNTKNDPYLYEIPHDESFDIDYEYEFIMCESIYKKRYLKK